eukprot:59326_1
MSEPTARQQILCNKYKDRTKGYYNDKENDILPIFIPMWNDYNLCCKYSNDINITFTRETIEKRFNDCIDTEIILQSEHANRGNDDNGFMDTYWIVIGESIKWFIDVIYNIYEGMEYFLHVD